MPRYDYKCLKCDKTFEAYHSMSEQLENCLCENQGQVQKVAPFLFKTEQKSLQKPGQLVKEFIQNSKQEIKEEKQRLMQEYSGDNID